MIPALFWHSKLQYLPALYLRPLGSAMMCLLVNQDGAKEAHMDRLIALIFILLV